MPNVIKFGGGGGLIKLWENPNPNSPFSSTLDTGISPSDYPNAKFFVLAKMNNNATDSKLTEIFIPSPGQRRLLSTTPNAPQISTGAFLTTFRSYSINLNTGHLVFEIGTAGFVYTDGGAGTGQGYCIPLAVYYTMNLNNIQ